MHRIPDLLLHMKILDATSAYRPVLEGTVVAKTEALRIVSYGSADFGCLLAPPDVRKWCTISKAAIWLLCVVVLVTGHNRPIN